MASDLLTPDWLGYIPRAVTSADRFGADWSGYPAASPAAKKVLPSFGTSGIPKPTLYSPAGATPGATTDAATAAGTGTSANPFSTLSTVKNPAIDARIADILKTFDTVAKSTPEDFVSRLKAAGPEFSGYTKEDIGTLSDITGGGLENKLATLRAGRRAAVRTAADRALGDLTRILSLGRMAGGGAAPLGTSSYLQKLGLDKASEIETAAGLDEATQARNDLDFLTAQKNAALGKRGELLQSDVMRSLLPSQVNASWFNQLVQSLLPIIQGSNLNTITGIRGPGDYVGNDYSSLQAARLGDLSRIDTATNNAVKNALESQGLGISQQNADTARLRTILGLA